MIVKRESNNKKYIRKIEGMGEGLVLFEISSIDKIIGQNFHMFFEDKRKPPLDIAINPHDGRIEYISCFAQDEVIKKGSIEKKIIIEKIGISISSETLNENNANLTVEGKFVFITSNNDIWILREDITSNSLNAYELNETNWIIFSNNIFCGIVLKDLKNEELQELYNSKCLL